MRVLSNNVSGSGTHLPLPASLPLPQKFTASPLPLPASASTFLITSLSVKNFAKQSVTISESPKPPFTALNIANANASSKLSCCQYLGSSHINIIRAFLLIPLYKVGLDLSAKFNQHDTNYHSYKKFLSKFKSFSLFFQPTSETEVIQLIHFLKNKNSCGPDEISAKFVILAADIIATLLKILFNYTFEFGIFPDCFKTAEVIPIYKQGDKMEMGNYRPISILSTFSKILEKLIYNRTKSFLEKHSIILTTQYGFRPAYSTSHAMIDILTSTLDNINVNKNTALPDSQVI